MMHDEPAPKIFPSRLRVGWTVVSFALGTVAAGCGGANAPEPRSASSIAAPTPAPVPPSRANSDTPSAAASVAISDEIRARCGIPDEDAYFPFDSTRLDTEDRSALDSVARCFSTGPLKGRRLRLIGRADPRGPTDYNMVLGLSRADAVGHYLVTHGLAKTMADTTSRGAMDATGTDEGSWQKDRRVDVALGN
jgi:peptidoglycan-associated lipoprotein